MNEVRERECVCVRENVCVCDGLIAWVLVFFSQFSSSPTTSDRRNKQTDTSSNTGKERGERGEGPMKQPR